MFYFLGASLLTIHFFVLVFLFLQDHLISSQLFVLYVFVFVVNKHWIGLEVIFVILENQRAS